jgi:hypothetical protein
MQCAHIGKNTNLWYAAWLSVYTSFIPCVGSGSFCVAFECKVLFGSDFKVKNGHGIEKKEVNNK